MYKTTTPTFNLTIPFAADDINNFVLSLVQQGQTVFTFTQDDCVVTDNKITLTLTQEQSAVFVHRYPIHLQVRIMLNSGVVVSSAVEHIYVQRSLNNTILTLIDKTDDTSDTNNVDITLNFNDNDVNLTLEFE